MAKQNRRYKLRYKVEPWAKPVPIDDKGAQLVPGVRASNSNFGYTDRLFIASIIEGEDGNESVLLLDSEDGPNLKRAYLEMIKDQIDHFIQHHCEG